MQSDGHVLRRTKSDPLNTTKIRYNYINSDKHRPKINMKQNMLDFLLKQINRCSYYNTQ